MPDPGKEEYDILCTPEYWWDPNDSFRHSCHCKRVGLINAALRHALAVRDKAHLRRLPSLQKDRSWSLAKLPSSVVSTPTEHAAAR